MSDLEPVHYCHDQPWIRQPCDTKDSWPAFQAYRDQTPPRNLRRVSEATSKHYGVIKQWSARNGWVARCAALDAWHDEQRRQAILEVLTEDARTRGARHIRLTRDMQESAAHVVRHWLKRIRDSPETTLSEFTPRDVTSMVKAAIELERLVHGESTQNVDNKHGFDLGRLTIDEIQTLRALEVKATDGE